MTSRAVHGKVRSHFASSLNEILEMFIKHTALLASNWMLMFYGLIEIIQKNSILCCKVKEM